MARFCYTARSQLNTDGPWKEDRGSAVNHSRLARCQPRCCRCCCRSLQSRRQNTRTRVNAVVLRIECAKLATASSANCQTRCCASPPCDTASALHHAIFMQKVLVLLTSRPVCHPDTHKRKKVCRLRFHAADARAGTSHTTFYKRRHAQHAPTPTRLYTTGTRHVQTTRLPQADQCPAHDTATGTQRTSSSSSSNGCCSCPAALCCCCLVLLLLLTHRPHPHPRRRCHPSPRLVPQQEGAQAPS